MKFTATCKYSLLARRILFYLHCSWKHLTTYCWFIFFQTVNNRFHHVRSPTSFHIGISFRFCRHFSTETTNLACSVYWITNRVDSARRVKVFTWQKLDPARRVTLSSRPSHSARRVTLPAESSLFFSCKRFSSLYKEIYGKLAPLG